MADSLAVSKKAPPLAPGEFRFISKALGIEQGDDGKRRFKMIASSTVTDQGNDEIKMSALEDLRAAFSGGLNIFTDHEHRVDNVFGRSDSAEIRASGERDPKTGNPIYDLHIAGLVNEPNPRMVQLADSIDGGYVTFGASIGARLREHKKNKAGGYDIYHLEGKEASLVGIPMNQRSWTYKSALIGRAVGAAERLGDAEMVDDDDDEEEASGPRSLLVGEAGPEAVVILPEAEKADLSAASRNNLPDSAFACPEKRKYPINDKAHIRAALSRIADPSNDQCGRDKIIAAARREGIGDHKGFGDDDLVTWASVEFPAAMITKDENDEDIFIEVEKALDTTEGDPLVRQDLEGPKEKSAMCPDCGRSHDEAGDCSNSYHTKSADEADLHTTDVPADGQESGSAEADTPETPETASAADDEDAEKAFAYEAEDVISLAKRARDLVQMVQDRDTEIESLKAERDRLASENEEAKSVLEKIVAMPLRRKAVYTATNFAARLPDFLAPEVKDYLTKSAGDKR